MSDLFRLVHMCWLMHKFIPRAISILVHLTLSARFLGARHDMHTLEECSSLHSYVPVRLPPPRPARNGQKNPIYIIVSE